MKISLKECWGIIKSQVDKAEKIESISIEAETREGFAEKGMWCGKREYTGRKFITIIISEKP